MTPTVEKHARPLDESSISSSHWAFVEVPDKPSPLSYLKSLSLRSLIRLLLPVVGMILLSRAQMLKDVRPFAAAFAMAACTIGISPLSLLVGSVIGVLVSGAPFALAAEQCLSCLSVTSVYVLLGLAKGKEWEMPLWTASLIAGVSIMVPALALSQWVLYNVLMAILSGVFGALLTVVFVRALRARLLSHRTVLSADEMISIALCVSLFLLGLSDIRLFGVSLMGVCSIFLCLLGGYLGGTGAGAAVGVLLGFTLSLGGAAAVYMPGLLGFAGLMAGTMRPLRRPGTALAFLAAQILATVYAGEALQHFTPFVETLVAALVFLLLPGKWLMRMRETVDADWHKKASQKYYARRIRELTVKRLHEFSEVFDSMGKAFSRIVHTRREDEEQRKEGLIEAATEKVCAHCGLKARCWHREAARTRDTVLDLMDTLYENGGKTDKLPDSWERFCLHPHEMAEALMFLSMVDEMDRRWENRVQECRELVGQQLDGVSQVVGELALKLDEDVHFSDDRASHVLEDADRCGIRLREVLVQEAPDGRIEVFAEMRMKKGLEENQAAVELLEQQLRSILHKRMRQNEPLQWRAGYTTLHFVEASSFALEVAVAQRAYDGVCGDSYVVKSLPGDKMLLALSDGMGTGERAAEESRMTVRLLEEFFRAGFNEELILRSVNQLMLLRKPDEMFSTVDMCLVDLVEGMAEFIKIGATFGCLRRMGHCRIIRSNSLPLGILEEVSPKIERFALQDGDQIVLISDGVADVVGDRGENWFVQALEFLDAPHPQDVANAVLREAFSRQDMPKDDMSILIAKVHVSKPEGMGTVKKM